MVSKIEEDQLMHREKYKNNELLLQSKLAKIDELNRKLNESIEKNVELNKDNAKHTRAEILSDVASDLADTEKDKFNGLAENVEYNSADDFRKKVETLKVHKMILVSLLFSIHLIT